MVKEKSRQRWQNIWSTSTRMGYTNMGTKYVTNSSHTAKSAIRK
jgi:hypothetical protein